MRRNKVSVVPRQRASSIPETSQSGFPTTLIENGGHNFYASERDPPSIKTGTKVAWIWRGLEVASIFAAITLSNIVTVKVLDALLDAVHN
jgi:hypothetical protein